MRITVVGAIWIIAGIVVVALMLDALLGKSNRGPDQADLQYGG